MIVTICTADVEHVEQALLAGVLLPFQSMCRRMLAERLDGTEHEGRCLLCPLHDACVTWSSDVTCPLRLARTLAKVRRARFIIETCFSGVRPADLERGR